MSKAVCNSCKHYDINICKEKLPLYPDNRNDCWMYYNKLNKFNLAENSKGNYSDRIEGMHKY